MLGSRKIGVIRSEETMHSILTVSAAPHQPAAGLHKVLTASNAQHLRDLRLQKCQQGGQMHRCHSFATILAC